MKQVPMISLRGHQLGSA